MPSPLPLLHHQRVTSSCDVSSLSFCLRITRLIGFQFAYTFHQNLNPSEPVQTRTSPVSATLRTNLWQAQGRCNGEFGRAAECRIGGCMRPGCHPRHNGRMNPKQLSFHLTLVRHIPQPSGRIATEVGRTTQIRHSSAATPLGKTPPYLKLDCPVVRSAEDRHKLGRGKNSAEAWKSVRSKGVSHVPGIQRCFERGIVQCEPTQHDRWGRISRSGEAG